MKRKPKSSLGAAFNRMWGASLSANLADGIMMAAAPLLAVTLTKNPVLISAMSGMVMLPWLFFAIPIGVLVDRLDRRRLLASANATRFVVAVGVVSAVTSHTITIYELLLAAFIIGTCEVVADTSSQSLIPQILQSDQFERGNSRLQISEQVVQGFIGTPISGFLYATAIFLPFAANGLCYAVAATLAIFIPVHFLQEHREAKAPEVRPTFTSEMKFGLRYIAERPALRRLVLTTSAMGFFFSMSNATFVLFVLRTMHLRPALYGALLTVEGIGAVLGGLAAPKLSARFGRARTMGVGITASSFLTLAVAFSPNIYVFALLTMAELFAVSQWNILLMSLYQSTIPSDLYGRIHGARRTLVWGLMPIGSLLGGVLAKHGLRTPYYVGGAMCAIMAVFSLRFLFTVGTTASGETATSFDVVTN